VQVKSLQNVSKERKPDIKQVFAAGCGWTNLLWISVVSVAVRESFAFMCRLHVSVSILMAFSGTCNTTEMAEIEKQAILVTFCFNIAINTFLHLWIAQETKASHLPTVALFITLGKV
jgi:hypothetical protein